jgi:hypothetical protein
MRNSWTAAREPDIPAGASPAACERVAPAAGRGPLYDLLRELLEKGGLWAEFDPRVMATAIRAAIDAVPPRLTRKPDVNAACHGREMADLFEVPRPTRPRTNETAQAMRHLTERSFGCQLSQAPAQM